MYGAAERERLGFFDPRRGVGWWWWRCDRQREIWPAATEAAAAARGLAGDTH